MAQGTPNSPRGPGSVDAASATGRFEFTAFLSAGALRHDLVPGLAPWATSLSLLRSYLGTDFARRANVFTVGSPALDGLLFINTGGAMPGTGITALDWESGDIVWTATDHAASYATPIVATIHGRAHLFVLTYEGLVSLRPKSGEVDWEIPFRPRAPDSVNATSPTVVGNHVVAV